MPLTLTTVPATLPYGIAVHGGAGPRTTPATEAHRAGLRRSVEAGAAVLADGGSAVDAVSAAVMVLEDDEHFNAGRGAALTSAGTAELDACLCDGRSGLAGAVASCTTVRNPVLAARAVMERTPHVLLVSPDAERVAGWGLVAAGQDYFVTEARRLALASRTPDPTAPVMGHGTVGAVARDASGGLAAATSTGGVTGQWVGRVGDTPVIGAGTWADGNVAISCTGIGEFFLRSALAHDVAARMRWAGHDLPTAVGGAITEHLVTAGGDGGLIAIGADGTIVLGFCSTAMFRAHLEASGVIVGD